MTPICQSSDFNPRSRMGSDQATGPYRTAKSEFQSTLPHGERPAFCPTTHSLPVFQSTLPHGERQYDPQPDVEVDVISIHAPAWGATGDGLGIA